MTDGGGAARRGLPAPVVRVLPGLGACAVAVLAAAVVGALVRVVPLLTIAVLLGIVVALSPAARKGLDGPLAAGVRFASKTLMRAGIVLLGLQVGLGDIAGLGAPAILAVVGLVALTFAATWGFGRAVGLPGREPLLIAAGFSICGASAIGAVAGATGARREEQAVPVALVTLCGTLAIAVLPALGALLGLRPSDFGFWVGAGVHDVGQVVATAQTAGAVALAVAVVVKLTRVVLLAPLVAGVALAERRAAARGLGADGSPSAPSARPAIVPLFVVGFLVAVLLNSFVPLPPTVLVAANSVQTVLLAAALFALGTGVRLGRLRTGGRALVVGLVSWALIAVLAYLVAVHVR